MSRMNNLTRRAFLNRAGALSALGAAGPWATSLATMADAAAATAPADYKALVCVFLNGGNDHANTIIPVDQDSYALYKKARDTLALDKASLQGVTLSPLNPLSNGRSVAMSPFLAPLKPLFDARRLAVLLNIGPLMRPTTLEGFRKSVDLPPRLFSHNDQQAVWQSYQPEGGTVGWGGRIGDLINASTSGASAFTCVNLAGNAVFLSGQQVTPYALAPDGPAPLLAASTGSLFGSGTAGELLQQLMTRADHPVLMARSHAGIASRALSSQQVLSDALPAAPSLAARFVLQDAAGKSFRLAQQLHMVARLIAARQTLGLRRQVFFVSLGGFDLHDRMNEDHGPLLGQIGQALASFDMALRDMGVDQQVTTFTASDFGRTLSSNGNGSDHGWGGHHMVMGGAVAGGRLYGDFPHPGLNGPEDVGQGRLLPALAVDQLAASLARWMGVPASDLDLVAPRHGLFDASVLGGLLPAGI